MLKNSDIAIAKVDATEESALGKRYEVSGYPTMKLFRRGKAFEYEGAREANGRLTCRLMILAEHCFCGIPLSQFEIVNSVSDLATGQSSCRIGV